MFNISYFNISLQILKLQNVSENLSVCTISALPQLFTARLVACEWTGSSSDFHQQLGWGTILPVNRFGGQSCRHSTCVDFGRDDDNYYNDDNTDNTDNTDNRSNDNINSDNNDDDGYDDGCYHGEYAK